MCIKNDKFMQAFILKEMSHIDQVGLDPNYVSPHNPSALRIIPPSSQTYIHEFIQQELGKRGTL